MSTNGNYPHWVEKMLDLYRDAIAHAFILYFNIGDYVAPQLGLRSYLGKVFAKRDVIVFYDLARGLSFARPSDEKRFREIVGLAQASDKSSMISALEQSKGGGALPKSPAQVFPLLERLLKTSPSDEDAAERYGGAVVVIEYGEMLAPAADLAMLSPEDREILIRLESWGRDAEIGDTGNPLFLVVNELTQVHENIRRASARWEAVEIPLPDQEARLKYIESYVVLDNEDDNHDGGFDWGEIDPAELSARTAGLSLVGIEDVFLRAGRLGVLSADLVTDRKKALIASEYAQVIEVWEPEETFDDIGGLDQVKEFFRRSVIEPIRIGNVKRIPQGVLMVGPPGTGKTILARALANEAGVNAVLFRVGQILGKYVGESESKLERALRAIQAMAPLIVFIDEIDQQISRGESGESDVSKRIFARLLEIMSDNSLRGKVLWLAASNRPDLIDSAMKRPGRFDQAIAFLVPEKDEREAIFEVMARKYLDGFGMIPPEVVTETEGWTGAEIESAVVKAYRLTQDEKLDKPGALLQAVRRLRPSTGDIDFMTDLAIAEISDTDLLPEKYRVMLDDREALEDRIADQTERRRSPREV